MSKIIKLTTPQNAAGTATPAVAPAPAPDAAPAPAAARARAPVCARAAAGADGPGGVPDFAALIREFQHGFGSALEPASPDDRPLHGQTLHIASCALDLRFGAFRAHIFQDIIDKHYIIALVHGDIRGAETLYTRLHSSCVTSETLRGIDCDCVQQLEGALEIIAKKGRGILFYLMQEGRGVGYTGKARDRMLVQASLDRLDTFQAYAAMGLRKDHRNYDNISHICHLLGITASFIVLTNNPDKLDALRAQGINVAAAEPIEFEPSPFNLAYLTSKATGGHHLTRPAASDIERALPPEPVTAFRPHALARARRFICTAGYFLPIKPVDSEILLNAAQFSNILPDGALERHMAGPRPLITGCRRLRGHRHLVRIDKPALAAHARAHPGDPVAGLLATPYWFRTHVYYDIVTSQDFVVLTHGAPGPADTPVIRIHSESLFNRFPLRAAANRDKMKQSIRRIVAYGAGAMLLLHNDGRGAGFGAYATDRMMSETGQALSTDEAYRKLGVGYDSRDYDAAMLLLRHHIPNEKIQMIMNSPASLVKKNEYASALNAHKFDVEKWIFLDENTAE
ncbi:MAG: GTP cyclohydrolase [Opitutaceae bacterium]|nr:GTP cyclohydrolase [Opitutaceae bacterium]